MIVRRSALVTQPASHLFDLIEAAEHYPSFLPWCAEARIISRDEQQVSAELKLSWHGVTFDLHTRNPKQRPHFMAIRLAQGPFSRFEGEWRLTELGASACKVAFLLDYEFNSAWMTRAAGTVFSRVADSLVDAFVAQAMATAPPEPAPPASAA